jgi:hypothetical protein
VARLLGSLDHLIAAVCLSLHTTPPHRPNLAPPSSYCGHQGHWPGFLAPPLPARSRSYHSIFTKCRTKYEGHIVTSSVVAFPCPPRALTECFLHRPNTQPPFCRGQAFVVGWLCPSSLCPPSSSFISKATSFHAPLSFVAALVPQERGACSQPCGTGLLPRTSHIVATDELLSLVPKPSRRHLAIYFYASSHSIVGLLGSIKRPQQNVQPKDSTRSVE